MDHPHLVEVHIGHEVIHIAPGPYTVPFLKEKGHVPLAYELDQIIDHKLVPLADDATVQIHGHERFAGQPRKGSSA